MVIYHLRSFITHVDVWNSHLLSSVSCFTTLFFLLYVFLLILSLCVDSSTLESPSRLDEEHRLIARYAARLAAEASNSTVRFSSQTHSNYTSPYVTGAGENVLLMTFTQEYTFVSLSGIYWKSTACLLIFFLLYIWLLCTRNLMPSFNSIFLISFLHSL